MLILVVLLAVLLLSFLAGSLSFWLGGRCVGAPKATFGRALLAFCAVFIVSLLFFIPARWLESTSAEQDDPVALAGIGILLIAQLILVWLIIRMAFGTTFGRAILAWLIATIPSIGLAVAIVLGLKAFVLNAYVVPTNSMAPAVIGWHRTDTCPHCQRTLIVPAVEPGSSFPPLPDMEELSICASCRKTILKVALKSPLLTPDRILVNKLATPKRWDIITYRPPENLSTLYVGRLVGLPGEKIVIKNGAIWIDDRRMDPPDHLAGMEYTTEMEHHEELKGTPERPLQLGPDEYCILGDFAKRSNDSRFWGPLPGANIEAVVSLCYWPMDRWRIFP